MTVRVRRELPLPAEHCFRLFCEAEATPGWVSGILNAEVQARHPDGRPSVVAFRVRTAGGIVQYTLAYAYDRVGHRVTWRPRTHAEHGVQGYAAFESTEGGCLMTYALQVGASRDDHDEAGERAAAQLLNSFERYVSRSRTEGLGSQQDRRDAQPG